jgi:hypothetical protein
MNYNATEGQLGVTGRNAHVEQIWSTVPQTAEQLLHPRRSSQSGHLQSSAHQKKRQLTRRQRIRPSRVLHRNSQRGAFRPD